MKFRKLLVKTFIIGLMIVPLVGCGKKTEPTGPAIAKFKGGQITQEEFTRKLNHLPKEIRAAAVQQKKAFLEELIDEYFLEKEAIRLKIDEEADVKQTLDQARRKIMIAKLIETEVDKKVLEDPDEAKRFYEANKGKFMTPLMIRASHILVKTEEEAAAVKTQLDAGVDFEQLAREKSIHKTAMAGGDIGFFQKGKLIPEFEEAAFKLNKGEISGVVKSQFGYHVIKLTDRIEPSLKTFDTVKDLVQQQLRAEKKSKLFKEYVSSLRAGVKVDIDEGILEKTS